MLRFLGIATLILMFVCLAIGASIALANASSTPAEPNDISNLDI